MISYNECMSLKFNITDSYGLPCNIFVPVFSDSLKDESSGLASSIAIIAKKYNFEASFMEKFRSHWPDVARTLKKGNMLASAVWAKDVELIGLGTKKDLNHERIFQAFSSITYGEIQKKYYNKEISILYPDYLEESEEFLHTSINGLNNGHYVFDKYKTKKNNLSDLTINLVISKMRKSSMDKLIDTSSKIFQGVNFTKDLVNEQPLVLTPTVLANFAKKISKHSNITCTVFDKNEILERKMSGLWDVGKGSTNKPKFIHLKYKSKKLSKSAKKIAIIGKGMTYDSGGLSLKPADYMLTMKMDMAGAGCVLGVFEALGQIQPKNIEVHGLIPTAENMPGPNAYKPDDIVKGLSKKTIEIINTDAEGRVILSDAIEYANRLKVDEMVDLATLTGACMVALGHYTAGLFSNNEKLTNELLDASKSAAEKLWQLPLDDELRQDIDSQIADIKNAATTRYGGAITAAMFLEFFVKDIPWSHIDIAGPAYIEKKRSWTAVGSTGYGVRTILNYLGI